MIILQSGLTSLYSDNHPRVLWDNAAFRATIGTSSEQTGFEGVNAASAVETSSWKAADTVADEWLEIELSSAESLTSAAVAAHDLFTQGATAKFQYHDGTSWVQLGADITPTSNRPFAVLFNSQSATRFRLLIEPGADAPCRVGCVFFGAALEFPQQVFTDQPTPFNMARTTEYVSNVTVSGRYAGRTVKRQREVSEATFRDIRETWISNNMLGFIDYARSYPYFFLPRPSSYPDNIGYTWKSEDIIPTRTGISGNMMEFKL